MAVQRHDTMPVISREDVVRARQKVREWAIELGFSLVDQTKIVTATSELARNMVEYGGGGQLQLEAVNNGHHQGLRLTFEDQGPGISNLELAMKDGYTTGTGLGLGLGGARRLSNEFEISSQLNQGTRVCITKWK